MVNVSDRWARDKTDDLQEAFFNGVGYVSWENIWGYWNGITPHDAEALRRTARIKRQFAPLLVSPRWEPHTPTLQYGSFASKFPGDGQTLWTFINRNEYDLEGNQIRILTRPGQSTSTFITEWNSLRRSRVIPRPLSLPWRRKDTARSSPASHPDPGLSPFLSEMKRLTCQTTQGVFQRLEAVETGDRSDYPNTKIPPTCPIAWSRCQAGTFDFHVFRG